MLELHNLGKYEVIDTLEDWFTTNPILGQVGILEFIIELGGLSWRLHIGGESVKLQSTDTTKREAVALFREKLQAALKEIEGL